jgi:hypothetical protein
MVNAPEDAISALPWPSLPATRRVPAFVEDFRSRTDQPLPMTRAPVGPFLGMAEETVARAFKALAATQTRY